MVHFYSLQDAKAAGLLSDSATDDDPHTLENDECNGANSEKRPIVVTDLESLRAFKQARPKYPTVAQKWWS